MIKITIHHVLSAQYSSLFWRSNLRTWNVPHGLVSLPYFRHNSTPVCFHPFCVFLKCRNEVDLHYLNKRCIIVSSSNNIFPSKRNDHQIDERYITTDQSHLDSTVQLVPWQNSFFPCPSEKVKTKQNKTKNKQTQNKTRQNKTKQSKTTNKQKQTNKLDITSLQTIDSITMITDVHLYLISNKQENSFLSLRSRVTSLLPAAPFRHCSLIG